MHLYSNETFNIATLYIGLWLFYDSLGFLGFGYGNLISQALLAVLLLTSLYYYVYVNFNYSLPPYFNACNVFLGVLSLYGFWIIINQVVLIDNNGIYPNYAYQRDLIMSLTPSYAIYHFSKRGLIDEKNIKYIIALFLVVTTFCYWYNYYTIMNRVLGYGGNFKGATNNLGYNFLSLMPLAALLRNNFLKYAMLMFTSYYVFMSMKRGAMLIGALCLVYFMYMIIKNASQREKRILLWSNLMIIILSAYVVVKQLGANEYFVRRLEQTSSGDTSGRDRIYRTLWGYFTEVTTPIQQLFGSGAEATLGVAGIHAHQDWIEIAVNHGVLGLVLYVYYWYYFYGTVSCYKHQRDEYLSLRLVLIITFCSSLFSMSYLSMKLGAVLALGYSLAQYDKITDN